MNRIAVEDISNEEFNVDDPDLVFYIAVTLIRPVSILYSFIMMMICVKSVLCQMSGHYLMMSRFMTRSNLKLAGEKLKVLSKLSYIM